MVEAVQPIFILPEGYTRTTGKDAQRNNIAAAIAVADTVKSTLGPRGMDKMLIDNIGDITITNDGVTVLKSMEIDNPAAKMLVEIAKTQEEVAGDGTTSSVILAGEMLKKAESLLDSGLHPALIAKGYKLATEKSIEILNEIKEKVDISNKEELSKIVKTAIIGKLSGSDHHIINLLVDAINHVKTKTAEGEKVDLDNIKIEKKSGGGMQDSLLVDGVILEKEKVHPDMPDRIENAKIALLNLSLEVEKGPIDAQIRIDRPEQLESFVSEQQKILKGMVDKIKASGANVVICEKGIDDVAQHFLAKAGILAFRRVSDSDVQKIGKATGAKIVSTLDALDSSALGEAGVVHMEKIGNETMAFIEKCKNPKAVTILVRGGSEHVVDEIKRAIEDALGDLKSVVEEDGSVVAGGGAVEMELSKRLKEFASTLKGKEQLAVQAFAEALEAIPRTLAENAGSDPMSILVELRSAHQQGKKWVGINLSDPYDVKIDDMMKIGVIEPLRVKRQAVKSAGEVAVMILRIDDIIAAGKSAKMESKQPPSSYE
ncbi:MAG: thermosome subunit beta [Candidatus Parvarchaeota archaeon]|nr:thermosome subunit beta [Candidatus Rehaiarchaeum fermentans]